MLEFLQALVKMEKPTANLRDGVLSSIRAAAEGSALKVSDYPNGFKVGDSETAAVVVQFGGRREFYETIEMLGKEQVDYRIIVTSSNVKSMKIGEIKWILNNKYQTKDRWLIIDLERKEQPRTVNFMLYGGEKKERGDGEPAQPDKSRMVGIEGYDVYPEQKEKPKRKKIYGIRGEHKEQD